MRHFNFPQQVSYSKKHLLNIIIGQLTNLKILFDSVKTPLFYHFPDASGINLKIFINSEWIE